MDRDLGGLRSVNSKLGCVKAVVDDPEGVKVFDDKLGGEVEVDEEM